MTNKKKLTIRKVEVEWVDSSSVISMWHDVEEALKGGELIKCKTIGYLYKKTKEGLCLAMALHFEGGEITRLGDLFYIPKGCVKKITHLV